MWKFLIFCRIQLKNIKNVETHYESFILKTTSNKKVIAKKPLTNLYEMNSNNAGKVNGASPDQKAPRSPSLTSLHCKKTTSLLVSYTIRFKKMKPSSWLWNASYSAHFTIYSLLLLAFKPSSFQMFQIFINFAEQCSYTFSPELCPLDTEQYYCFCTLKK